MISEALNKALRILHGQDWLSLMTCTPYGINTHRLIVQAKRVAYNGEDDAPTPARPGGYPLHGAVVPACLHAVYRGRCHHPAGGGPNSPQA